MDIFNTTVFSFTDDETFQKAIALAADIEQANGEHLYDVDYADRILSIFSEFGAKLFVAELKKSNNLYISSNGDNSYIVQSLT